MRGLASAGTLDYRVFAPPVAPDAGEGLPTEVVAEYRRAHSMPQRLAAMGLGAARPGPLRRHLEGATIVHYPLTIAIPPARVPTVVTLYDVQHLDLPQMFSRAERAFRSLATTARRGRGARRGQQRVRPRPRRRAARARPRGSASSLSGSTTRPSPRATRLASRSCSTRRAWPHKNHERLFQAFSLVRRARPELRLVLTGGGHSGACRRRRDPRPCLAARARLALPPRLGARLPVALRGLRTAAARGDGVRLPGRVLERRVAPRGLRRRRALLRPERCRRDRHRRPRRAGRPRAVAGAVSNARRGSRGSAPRATTRTSTASCSEPLCPGDESLRSWRTSVTDLLQFRD